VADKTPEAAVPGSGRGLLTTVIRRAASAAARGLVLVDQVRGLPEARESLTTDCPQCGRDSVDVIRLTSRRARLACRACGAVVAIADVGRLHPVVERRIERARDAAAELAVSDEPDPRVPFLPPLMLAWARATEPAQSRRLDKASIYGLWKKFDRFLAAARTGGEARSRYSEWAAKAGVVDQVPETLPSFGEIVGLLHSHCYSEEAVTAALGRASDVSEGPLAERVSCARRWLAGPGREHCWIDRQVSDDPVDREALRPLMDPESFDGSLAPEQRQALFAAVFGTLGGPPTAALLTRFGPDLLRRAVETHLRDGSHPLRETVLQALEGVSEGPADRQALAAAS
jgi:hypothetical protein